MPVALVSEVPGFLCIPPCLNLSLDSSRLSAPERRVHLSCRFESADYPQMSLELFFVPFFCTLVQFFLIMWNLMISSAVQASQTSQTSLMRSNIMWSHVLGQKNTCKLQKACIMTHMKLNFQLNFPTATLNSLFWRGRVGGFRKKNLWQNGMIQHRLDFLWCFSMPHTNK